MKWFAPYQVYPLVETIEDFGHKKTLDEVDQQAEDLWGGMEEDEDSIPLYRVVQCPNGGFHLQTIRSPHMRCKIG